MNDDKLIRVHWSFWTIGAFAIIWNFGGILNFFMQMDLETVATFPETHRAIIQDRPLWATGGFAVTVFCGMFGGILLMLKKSAAAHLFTTSLIGAVVTMIHTVRIASFTIEFTPSEILVMIVMPLVVVIFLIWYTKQVRHKNWIG